MAWTPPATAVSIEEREAAIRQERARRLPRHPGLSPQEKAALHEWEECDRLTAGAEALVRDLDAKSQGQRAQTSAATYAWKSDVSGFAEQIVYKENVRCPISDSVYTGYYKASRRHGRGAVMFDDGSAYDGEFVEDDYCGTGVETSESGRYVGEFKANKKHGNGTFYWTDGRRYEGQWKSDRMSGFGGMDWRDGRHYHGFFDADDFHGDGVFAWPDGRKLDASFSAGRAVEGVLTEADGVRFRVRYGKDRPGAQVSKSSFSLGQPATSLICYGTLPEPTNKEPHHGRETVAPPRTSGVAQPNMRQGDLARVVPL